ncbi:hypothetical protein [Bacillus alkalicellulosilyticus]|uniref:hypothetical protein n=1 Tax=Alkalihalobacterium alkalicellulosilyticum TaxID=1912214 RepID=UPI00099839C0|nr:hypothetical protein [Bacillus alkalicellulosilyticus]
MRKIEVKKVCGYALFSFILVVVVFLYFWVRDSILAYQSMTFRVWPSLFILPLMTILLGTLLAGEHWYQEKKEEGKWKIRRVRLLLVGVPIIMLTFSHTLFLEFDLLSLPSPLYMLLVSNSAYLVGGIFLGYFIVTSFKKGTETP